MLTIRGRLITPFILGSLSVGLNILIRHLFTDLCLDYGLGTMMQLLIARLEILLVYCTFGDIFRYCTFGVPRSEQSITAVNQYLNFGCFTKQTANFAFHLRDGNFLIRQEDLCQRDVTQAAQNY